MSSTDRDVFNCLNALSVDEIVIAIGLWPDFVLPRGCDDLRPRMAAAWAKIRSDRRPVSEPRPVLRPLVVDAVGTLAAVAGDEEAELPRPGDLLGEMRDERVPRRKAGGECAAMGSLQKLALAVELEKEATRLVGSQNTTLGHPLTLPASRRARRAG